MEIMQQRPYKNLPCAWCGEEYYDRAHVPTKFLIHKSNRNRPTLPWPILPSCRKCNEGLKLDEEWFAVHFASALYSFSDVAQRMFDGPISKHLKKHRSIAARYNQYLELVNLTINGVSQGLKTRIDMSQEDWDRLSKVAEMFARGLYYWHTGNNAKHLKAKINYLSPSRFNKLKPHISGLKRVELFPIEFEYAYGIVEETGEASFTLLIYGKPCFVVLLIKPEKYSKMEEKVKRGKIKISKGPQIEILG